MTTQLFYKLAYSLGFTPWEDAARHSAAADIISALLDQEAQDRTPPLGRALDLGCGSGIQAVDLARRGWDVTGIDIVPKALRTARERAQAAGVDIDFVQGDVTRLRALNLGSGFRLVMDFGCFHGLSDEARKEVGNEVSAIAAPGATLLMISFAPGRRGPLPRGVSSAGIKAAFPGWRIISTDALPASALPAFLRNAAPRVYRLRRE